MEDTNRCIFRASLSRHQGAQNYMKQSLNGTVNTSRTTNCSQLLQTATYITHFEEFPAVLSHAGNENFKNRLYVFLYSMVMGTIGTKHVVVGVL